MKRKNGTSLNLEGVFQAERKAFIEIMGPQPLIYKPHGAYMLVEPTKIETKVTEGGFILDNPNENNDMVLTGKVIALGTGILLASGVRTEFDCEVGDTVVFKEYVGNKFTLDDKEYLLLLSGDILMFSSSKK